MRLYRWSLCCHLFYLSLLMSVNVCLLPCRCCHEKSLYITAICLFSSFLFFFLDFLLFCAFLLSFFFYYVIFCFVLSSFFFFLFSYLYFSLPLSCSSLVLFFSLSLFINLFLGSLISFHVYILSFLSLSLYIYSCMLRDISVIVLLRCVGGT